MERHQFETELKDLKGCVARMGGLVASRLETALRAFADHDGAPARLVLDGDGEVDDLQVDIDERALRILALQQPAARDLRFIVATIKANADLERIGDQAVNIAGSSIRLVNHPKLSHEPAIENMGMMALTMVRDALHAFINGDAQLAKDVIERDAQVDASKNAVLRELIHEMTGDTRSIEPAVSLVFISRNIERAADHATNMAEDAIFLVEARDVRHHHV